MGSRQIAFALVMFLNGAVSPQPLKPTVQIEGQNVRLTVSNHSDKAASYVVLPNKPVPWFTYLKARDVNGKVLTTGTDGWMLPADQDGVPGPLPLRTLLPGENSQVCLNLKSYLVGTRGFALIVRDTVAVKVRYRIALDGYCKQILESETDWIPFRFRTSDAQRNGPHLIVP